LIIFVHQQERKQNTNNSEIFDGRLGVNRWSALVAPEQYTSIPKNTNIN